MRVIAGPPLVVSALPAIAGPCMDRPEPEAFAVPPRHDGQGRIVVSSGMPRIPHAAERRVLLAVMARLQ
jgi:hypothetical protein